MCTMRLFTTLANCGHKIIGRILKQLLSNNKIYSEKIFPLKIGDAVEISE